MSKDKKVKTRKNPKNRRKEHASRKPRAPRKSLDERLKELAAHINDNYHAP